MIGLALAIALTVTVPHAKVTVPVNLPQSTPTDASQACEGKGGVFASTTKETKANVTTYVACNNREIIKVTVHKL
jgi:biopolymer transport protein ExbD